MLELFFDGDQLMAAADADAEQPGQRMHHLDGVGVFAALAHPGDGIQRIVQKVRVDLRLQRFELGLAQVDFLLAHGGHQRLDAPDHVPERIGEFLHFPRAGHRLERKAVGVLLKGFHGVFQPLQRAAEHVRDHPPHQQRRRQNQRGGGQRDARHLPKTFVDGLVDKADADDPPAAVGHVLDAVDDGIFDVGAVGQGGQAGGIFLLDASVQQLLLRVVDHVALVVHQKAVAVLADADAADAGANVGKPHVHRHPVKRRVAGHGPHNGDDPGVVPGKNRLDMRRADIPAGGTARRFQVKGKVLQHLRPGGVVQCPAVLQLAGIGVGRDGHDLAAGVEPGVQVAVALLWRSVHLRHDVGDGIVEVLHVVADGAHDLADGLGAVGAGVLHGDCAVPAQKRRHAYGQRHSRHRCDERDDQRRGARGAAAHAGVSCLARAAWRRSAPGDVPLYFLKQ